MPRLRYIDENEKTPHTGELIESAKRTGAPDPRVVSLMTRSKLGIAWVEYWNKLLYQGVLPHKLKEICRIKISVAHQCGYCSTVRSNVARAEGLTESVIEDLFDYAGSKQLSAREKAALHYADLFKQGEHAIDRDEVYTELAKQSMPKDKPTYKLTDPLLFHDIATQEIPPAPGPELTSNLARPKSNSDSNSAGGEGNDAR